MIPSGRLALWGLGLVLALSLFLRGQAPTQTVGAAPFFHASDGKVTVRLAGGFPRPGIYRFPDGTTAETVIKMTIPPPGRAGRSDCERSCVLRSGDVLELAKKAGKPADFSIYEMGVRERMLLRIPLDPDRMQAQDWDALPGIGPALAERIVLDRQANGAFGSLDGVLRVRGIGPAKLAKLRKFF